MRESRAAKYGRLGAVVLRYVVRTIPVSDRKEYLERFVKEFESYSDIPRRKGEPKNEGCVMELDGLDDLDIRNPEEFARWFKEGQHLKYQKNTARNERQGFLGALDVEFFD
jgi:hypothetical protein